MTSPTLSTHVAVPGEAAAGRFFQRHRSMLGIVAMTAVWAASLFGGIQCHEARKAEQGACNYRCEETSGWLYGSTLDAERH